ncbi:MAG: bifunctional UDP-N-acetylmuramoyl-tripeptide:D-alanyl-D-alanine ligase/alanine racemase [Bacteroidales bacterium]|jgi:alanine racemase|nr:bifunctional UDP-N-acetylmuramoyl-tripeptide:D-alanyl-D-alanine ligase/alanine racemase [Bacteroidales bacterium]
MIYTTTKISDFINAKFVGKEECEIKYLLIDSRSIISTSNTLFFAIRGDRHDGHNFIEDLYIKGIRNFVIESLPKNHFSFPNANFLIVKNSLDALQFLALNHRKAFNYPVIGITGSNGKTIVKEWLFHLLQDKKQIVRNPKSYNSQVGVPLSVWLMADVFDLAVFEAGISLPGEMEKLEKIIQPNIGLITNIGESHQENFSDYKQKASEKLKLFSNTDIIVYSKDHEIIDELIQKDEVLSRKQLFTWSEKNDADLKVSTKHTEDNFTQIDFQYNDQQESVIIPFADKASIEDAIHVLALLCALDFNPGDFINKFETLPPVAMRMELKKGINNCTIINDSYNSDLNSLAIALHYLDQQNQHQKKTLILSDILQSGKVDKVLYKEVTSLLSKFKIDNLVGIGASISSQADQFKLEKSFYKSTDDFLKDFEKTKYSEQAILLKGSRDFHFEKISSVLEDKAHRTILEINLNALVHNLNFFKSRLKSETKIMVMVKAVSYGSGTFEIANILQYQGVDYLGVAFADEGVTLREAGIKTPIIVMNPEYHSFELMLKHKLEPEIYSFNILHQFNRAVKNAKQGNYPVHIKLDTGMNRLGFTQNEIQMLIEDLKESNNLRISSIFSHLAASDDNDHDMFTQKQIALFDDLSKQIIKNFKYHITRHISNSAGIERFPKAQFDMVRLGIGLYGISTTNQERLATVSTLKSTVIQIKQVPKDESIGYNRKAKAEKDITIAVVPVGYADGLNRRLSNGHGKLYINGFLVPIIGNICMDMCMVDITNCNVHEGDEVIIFGKEQSVNELAKLLNTIPYEIFTSVSSRVKRVYFQE